MAIATKPKPTTAHHKKRTAAHHRQTKRYMKSYWPYLPMLAVVASGFLASSFLNRPAVLGAQSDLTAQQLLAETNLERSRASDESVTINDQLSQAALAKAQDMAARNYWAHITPTGQKPWSFITNAGYQYEAAGENLAYGFDSATSVTRAWMHSTEHRENLLNKTYTQVGFGVAQSPNYLGKGPETITVALYARPVAATPVSVPITTAPVASTSVSRISTAAESATGGFVVGLVGALALMFVLVRHGIAWRRLLNRGEWFVIQHPMIDVSLVAVATLAVVLSQTVGFIH